MKKALFLLINLLIISKLATAQSVTLATTTANPTKGTVVYNNGTNQLQYWNGSAWIPITNAAAGTGWVLNGNNIYNSNTGNVGIGTLTPKASFNVAAGKTVLFGLDSTNIGSKLIWYPDKGAFRVGSSGTYSGGWISGAWEYENVGIYSTVTGLGSLASDYVSTAIGNFNRAVGRVSTAMGNFTYSGGNSSTSMGNQTQATGDNSTAMGSFTLASTINSTAMGIFNIDVPNALLMIGNGTSYNARTNALTVMQDGKIGIGTTDPIAPLHVGSLASLSNYTNHYFSWATGSTIIPLTDAVHNIGILSEFDIVTKNSFVSSQTVTTSDSRIKNIIGLSNSQQDLTKIRQIQITDYRYKDLATWGNQSFKKVIAQQVEKVYPQAVRKMTSIIPDIYALAEKVTYNESNKTLTCSLSKDYDIKVGEKIEFVHEKEGKIKAEVIDVSGNSFTVKDWKFSTDKIFVYAREVNDFRTVDYEAISMLGISAIQELAKENDKLEEELKKLKADNKDLNARLGAIELLLSNAQASK